MQATKVKFRVGMTIVAVITVLSIVGAATFLTYVGKIEGSTFGFLLGLIIGYMLTFIRDEIGPTSTDQFWSVFERPVHLVFDRLAPHQ